jgi:CDP-glucose 4,6-dehydratase
MSNHPRDTADSLVDRLETFKGRSVFITGHTGFKGSWLALWLAKLGARVTGYALKPPTQPSNFDLSNVRGSLTAHHEADVRDLALLRSALERSAPEIVLHLAAQPLVLESYKNPRDTFEINVMGTANLLESIRQLQLPCSVVVVTSDKCYENREWLWGYRESDPMGGHDPYSASKGLTELLVSSYRRSFFQPGEISKQGVRLATARAGNVIGGGDWSPDHIIVDVIDALSKGRAIQVRSPKAIRPWQHVLESLSGYLTLASALHGSDAARYCDGWNFGPRVEDSIPVRDLVQLLIERWGAGSWIDASDPTRPHEAQNLRLSIEKAQLSLGWQPRWSVEEAVEHTVFWFRRYLDAPAELQSTCLHQIDAYLGTRSIR